MAISNSCSITLHNKRPDKIYLIIELSHIFRVSTQIIPYIIHSQLCQPQGTTNYIVEAQLVIVW